MTAEPAAVIRIRPRRGWVSLNLRELWSYRELAYFFVWRDLKASTKEQAADVLKALAGATAGQGAKN